MDVEAVNALKITDRGRRRCGNLIARGLACALLAVSARTAWSADCKPNHFRPPFFIDTMGRCVFDWGALSFQGEPAQQARCLMRGMDKSRNLGPTLESLPPALEQRVGLDSGLPTREALSSYLSKLDLEWDFAAHLWQPVSHANDNDPDAPMARYFVIHDTSGPNYGRRPFPSDINGEAIFNKLADFKCDDGWGKAHVVINRSGDMLLSHELSIPWRETRFEQAANFAGTLKGLFLHTELIQPRKSVGRRSRQRRADAQSRLHHRPIRPPRSGLRHRQRTRGTLAHSGVPCRARCRHSERPRRSAEFRR